MIAVDTNVVVRFLVNDEHGQASRARDLFANNDIWLAPSVLLETEWVLRSAYELPAADIRQLINGLLGLPHVQTDDLACAAQALDDFAAGLDFADALHLAFAGEADSFATFDRALARRATRLGRMKIIAL